MIELRRKCLCIASDHPATDGHQPNCQERPDPFSGRAVVRLTSGAPPLQPRREQPKPTIFERIFGPAPEGWDEQRIREEIREDARRQIISRDHLRYDPERKRFHLPPQQ